MSRSADTPAPAAPRKTGFDGRWLLLAIVPTYLALFFALSPDLPIVQVAKTWGILTQRPFFSDAYVIPAAVQTRASGGDPYLANPFDPWERTLNYPPAWLLLSPGNTSPAAVRAQALAYSALALAALLLVLGPLTPRQGLIVSLLGCSPAVLLAVERGNNDQLIFALVGFSLWLLRPPAAKFRPWLGYAGLGLTALLKLYPLAAFAVLARESGPALRRFGAFALALTILCLAVNVPYFSALGANTAAGGLHSYGATVAGFWLKFFSPSFGWQIDRAPLDLVARALALIVIAAAVRLGLASRYDASSAPPQFRPGDLDALRVGAAIYAGTFVLGSNFDYRLLFLFLCLPALFRSRACAGAARRDALITLAFLALTLWPNGLYRKPLLFVKLAANWALLFALTRFAARTFSAQKGRADYP